MGYFHPQNEIVTKIGSREDVLAHELGHFIDLKYDLANKLVSNPETNAELRILADKRYEGATVSSYYKKYVRQGSEKVAALIDAYITKPYLVDEYAPKSKKVIKDIIENNPELKPLIGAKPGLAISTEEFAKTIFGQSKFTPKGNVLEGYVDGKRKYIEVSKNLYQAMTGLNETSSGLLVKILSKPKQWLTIGATTTPEFVLKNPIRDQWTALIQTSLGWKPFVDTGAAIADILNKGEVYNDWIRSGGSYAGFIELSRPRLSKMVSELNEKPNLLANLNIITKLGDLSKLMEQATRLGVYKAGIKKGLSAVEASKESRESTVDFARRGSGTRDINATIAFFNAGLQGLDKTVRSFAKDPAGTTMKAIAAITIPSTLLYLKNRQDADYKELPRWQKDLFWMTKINGIWFRIPKPFLYGQIFGSVPERFFEYLDTKDPYSFDGLAKSLFSALSPISDDPLSGILPTAIKPLIENTTNFSFFRGRNIIPDSKKGLIPSEQYNAYDTETSKLLGKFLNVSPSQIENLSQGYFGGIGRYTLQTSDVGLKFINHLRGIPEQPGKPMELSDVPLIKGFVSRDVTSGQAESIQRFYDNRTKVSQAYLTYNKFRKEGESIILPIVLGSRT